MSAEAAEEGVPPRQDRFVVPPRPIPARSTATLEPEPEPELLEPKKPRRQILRQGWLEKKGGDTHLDEDHVLRKERNWSKGGRRNWKARWFILYDDGELAYFTDMQEEKGRLHLVRLSASAGEPRHGCSWHVRDDAPDEFLLALPAPADGVQARKAMLLRHAESEEVSAWIRVTSDTFGATVHPLLFTKEERGTAEQALIKVRAEVAGAVTTLATEVEERLQTVTFTDIQGQKVVMAGVGANGGGVAAPGAEHAIPPFEEEEWRAAVLTCHNEARSKHGAPPLAWSDECHSKALEQAEACEVEGKLHHGNYEGPSGRHGQNAYFSSNPAVPERAITAFYDEISLYDYGAPGLSAATGHFTQLVWKATTHVGMARSLDGKYLVANYLPPGNSGPAGAFAGNVPYPTAAGYKEQ